MTQAEIRQGIADLGPWFYPFDFGDGLKTVSVVPPAVTEIFDTRLRIVEKAVKSHFGDRVHGLDCLDIGCHEGFYSLAMARLGMKVTGIDAREENLRRARFVAHGLNLGSIEYKPGHVETLRDDLGRMWPLTLFLGVLYHVEDPVRCLRQVAAVTGEMCVIETQVVDEVEGYAEWGAREWTRPYHGILALIDESGEFDAGNRETGVTPLATCPSPKALLFMLRQAGFRRAEILPAQPTDYEQHARGKRVVCAAWK
jgi:ubiquinone/menaquinone biosynthesis C-methylase UbiE